MEMTREEKLKLRIRKRESNKTYTEVMKLIRKSDVGKCLLVRPTGFGKSYMLARVTSESTIINNGGKALYVYPYDTIKSDIEKKYGEDGDSDIKLQSTEFMTYRSFTNLGKENNGRKLIKYLNDNNIRILLLDEVHLAGSDGFRAAYNNVKHKIGGGSNKIRLIGVTATPYRMDGFNILEEIFDGHKVYDYTMDDCIRDGLMTRPVYKSALQSNQLANDIVAEYGKSYTPINKKILLDKAEYLVKNQDKIYLDEMTNPHLCIKNTIQRVLKEEKPRYLKFIVFFPTIKSMTVMEMQVTEYFSRAFPYLKQNILRVSSAKDSDSVEELHKLSARDGVVDLIFSVNKLNMGYHVDDINGIIMLRGTRSDIIYKQQIGRCMSITSKITPVIFDIMNNVSKKPYYKVSMDDFSDTEEDELDKQLSGDISTTEIEVNESSLDIEEDSYDYEYIVKELTLELNKMVEKEMCWVYKHRKTPLYILTDKYSQSGKSKQDVVKVLNRRKVEIEDETHLREDVDATVSRRLHNLNARRSAKNVE